MAIAGVTINEQQVQELSKILGRDGKVRKAALNAINRTLAPSVTRMVRQVGKEVTLEKESIREAITQRKATFNRLEGSITISGRHTPLYDFLHMSGKFGVVVSMRKSKGWDLFKHFFTAKVSTAAQKAQGVSHAGIFSRPVINNERVRRLPIKEAFGPSVLSLFGSDQLTKLGEEATADVRLRFRKNLQSQINRFLDRKKGDEPEVGEAEQILGY